MDKQRVIISESVQELELEILLHINERLFRNGNITEKKFETIFSPTTLR